MLGGLGITAMKAAGWFDIALAVFHMAFWRIFAWHQELARPLPTNGAIMRVLNIQMTLLFALFGILFLWSADEPFVPFFERMAMWIWSAFWVLRAVLQPVYFPRGIVSGGFTVLFGLGAALHIVAAFAR